MSLKTIIDDNLSKFLKLNESKLCDNFIIYPFGEGGMITKYLLNNKYGIEEKYVVDNILCKVNKYIKSIDDIDSNSNYVFLVSSNNKFIKDSLLNKGIHDNRILNVLDSLENSFYAPERHFYSPIPNIDEVKKYESDLFRYKEVKEIEDIGIKLNVSEQLNLVNEFSKFYSEIPFKNDKSLIDRVEVIKENALRYYYCNGTFEHSSAVILYSMIRYFKPRNIIEIGSGYSSCVMLDINEYLFNNNINCDFIEPYPDLLLSLLKETDNINLIKDKVQNVDIVKFKQLKPNDILFVDSSHVSKTASDVNYILFDILPNLNDGVIVHFHDIFYPFEYPKEWVYSGRAWNEDYILKAFLQYNSTFKIIYWNHFLSKCYSNIISKKLPICMKGTCGSSIWIQKF